MKRNTKGFLVLGVLPLAVMVTIYAVAVIAYADSTAIGPVSVGEVWPWSASVCVTGADPGGRDDVFWQRMAGGAILRTPRVGDSTWIGGRQ